MSINKTVQSRALQLLMIWIEGEAKKNLYANQELVNAYDGDRKGDNRQVQEIAQSLYTYIEGNNGVLATPLEEAFWYEYGTGSHSLNGKGRYGYWVYVDEDVPGYRPATRKVAYTEEEAKKCKAYLESTGIPADKVHISEGSEAKPFLVTIIRDRSDEVNAMFNKFYAQALAEELQKKVSKGVTVKHG